MQRRQFLLALTGIAAGYATRTFAGTKYDSGAYRPLAWCKSADQVSARQRDLIERDAREVNFAAPYIFSLIRHCM